ncbi:MAG: hypothetical protein NT070_23290 [Cyanobacteria bacterium]|nr:hypothetical protein [Cyanobacteriota bacterium]
MTNLPTIELEDDQDRDYMVLCYEGQRLDLEEFIYQPQNLYQLTHQATKEKKLFWVVGYEMPSVEIVKDDVQINLLLRAVKNSRGKLMASSELTVYDFPACLDDVLSPDDWAIAVLNDKVIFPRVEKKPTLLTIHKNDKPITKPPIDLSRTSLGQLTKPVPVQTPDVIPVMEERSQPEVNVFWVRRDDAQRVARILLKWVEISAQNPSEHLRWSIETLSSTGFNVMRKQETIFSFDVTTRQIISPLNLKQIKEEIKSMTTEALKTHPESLDSHELARHLFLRSVSFTEASFSGFWMHMLSLKKEGNDLKSNPTIRRTRRIPKF